MSDDIKKKIKKVSRIYDDEDHFPYTTLNIKDIVSEIATSEEDSETLLTLWDILEASIVQGIKDRKSIQLPYFGTFMPRKIKGYKKLKVSIALASDNIGVTILNSRAYKKYNSNTLLNNFNKKKLLVNMSLKSRKERAENRKIFKRYVVSDNKKAINNFKKLSNIKKELPLPNINKCAISNNRRLDRNKPHTITANFRSGVRCRKHSIINSLEYMGVPKDVIATIPFANRVGTKECLEKYKELSKITTAAKREFRKTKDANVINNIVEFLQIETK